MNLEGAQCYLRYYNIMHTNTQDYLFPMSDDPQRYPLFPSDICFPSEFASTAPRRNVSSSICWVLSFLLALLSIGKKSFLSLLPIIPKKINGIIIAETIATSNHIFPYSTFFKTLMRRICQQENKRFQNWLNTNSIDRLHTYLMTNLYTPTNNPVLSIGSWQLPAAINRNCY